MITLPCYNARDITNEPNFSLLTSEALKFTSLFVFAKTFCFVMKFQMLLQKGQGSIVHWEGYSRAWHTLHFTLLLVCLGSLVHLSTVQWWIIKRFFFFLQCSAERGLLKESLVLYTQGQICGHYMFLYWPKLANKDLLCRAFSYLYKTGFTLRFVQRITMHNKPKNYLWTYCSWNIKWPIYSTL